MSSVDYWMERDEVDRHSGSIRTTAAVHQSMSPAQAVPSLSEPSFRDLQEQGGHIPTGRGRTDMANSATEKCVYQACSPLPERCRAKSLATYRDPSLNAGVLARRIATEFLVTTAQMAGRDRHKSAAAARHLFWWMSRRLWGTSFPELGRQLRGPVEFDHTTCISAVRKIEREVDKEARYRMGSAERGSRVGAVALAILLELEGAAQPRATGATSGPRSSSGSKEGRGQL